MHIIILKLLIFFLILSCNRFSSSSQQISDVNAYVEEGKKDITKKTVKVDPTRTTEINLDSQSGEISGTSITLPPGSLALDANISVAESIPVANNATMSLLGLSETNTVQEKSAAVVIASDAKVDLVVPMTLTIPLKSSSNLLLNGSLDPRTIIVYVVTVFATGKNMVGIIPFDQIRYVNGKVEFDTKYFGSYQVAETKEEVKSEIKAETKLEPVSKVEAIEEAKIANPSIANKTLSFDPNSRKILVEASISNGEVAGCVFKVDKDKKEPIDFVFKSQKAILSMELSPSFEGAYFVKTQCQFISGVLLEAEWNNQNLVISRKIVNLEDGVFSYDENTQRLSYQIAANYSIGIFKSCELSASNGQVILGKGIHATIDASKKLSHQIFFDQDSYFGEQWNVKVNCHLTDGSIGVANDYSLRATKKFELINGLYNYDESTQQLSYQLAKIYLNNSIKSCALTATNGTTVLGKDVLAQVDTTNGNLDKTIKFESDEFFGLDWNAKVVCLMTNGNIGETKPYPFKATKKFVPLTEADRWNGSVGFTHWVNGGQKKVIAAKESKIFYAEFTYEQANNLTSVICTHENIPNTNLCNNQENCYNNICRKYIPWFSSLEIDKPFNFVMTFSDGSVKTIQKTIVSTSYSLFDIKTCTKYINTDSTIENLNLNTNDVVCFKWISDQSRFPLVTINNEVNLPHNVYFLRINDLMEYQGGQIQFLVNAMNPPSSNRPLILGSDATFVDTSISINSINEGYQTIMSMNNINFVNSQFYDNVTGLRTSLVLTGSNILLRYSYFYQNGTSLSLRSNSASFTTDSKGVIQSSVNIEGTSFQNSYNQTYTTEPIGHALVRIEEGAKARIHQSYFNSNFMPALKFISHSAKTYQVEIVGSNFSPYYYNGTIDNSLKFFSLEADGSYAASGTLNQLKLKYNNFYLRNFSAINVKGVKTKIESIFNIFQAGYWDNVSLPDWGKRYPIYIDSNNVSSVFTYVDGQLDRICKYENQSYFPFYGYLMSTSSMLTKSDKYSANLQHTFTESENAAEPMTIENCYESNSQYNLWQEQWTKQMEYFNPYQ